MVKRGGNYGPDITDDKKKKMHFFALYYKAPKVKKRRGKKEDKMKGQRKKSESKRGTGKEQKKAVHLRDLLLHLPQAVEHSSHD